MNRRNFITLLGATALPTSLARAQSKLPIVGFLNSFTETQATPALAAIRRGLGDNGLTEGEGMVLEARYADETIRSTVNRRWIGTPYRHPKGGLTHIR